MEQSSDHIAYMTMIMSFHLAPHLRSLVNQRLRTTAPDTHAVNTSVYILGRIKVWFQLHRYLFQLSNHDLGKRL